MDQVRPAVPQLAEARPASLARTGRDGFLRLAFEARGERTVLTERRFRTPLQVLEPLSFPDDPAAGVLMLNPTGGVLGGDRLETELCLGPGAHVMVSTPSATRVYGSRALPAVQSTVANVGREATLEYVPDHVIPHPGARVVQTLDVDLDAGARLLLWDAWALGRVARGEAWTFATLRGRVRVRSRGVPVFLDQFSLARAEGGGPLLAGAEGHAYFASWLAFCAEDDGRALAERLAGILEACPEVRGSASPLGRGGCAVRLLAASAYALLEARTRLWDATRAALLGLRPLDLRKA